MKIIQNFFNDSQESPLTQM